MPRANLQTPSAPSVPIEAKRARRKIIHDISMKIKSSQDLNGINSGAEGIINEHMLIYPWLTRNMVFSYLGRLKKKEKKNLEKLIENNSNKENTNNSTTTKSIGRPNGSTIKSITDMNVK